MEPKFQSSFIPKGPITPLGYSKPAKSRSIVGVVSAFIFGFAVLLSLGVFGYERYLMSRISTMGEDLAAAKSSIQPEAIRELMRMDTRILSTTELLKRHTALSPVFEFLEASTLKNLRFTEVTYLTTDKGITFTMKGEAKGYTAVALQSEIFNRSKFIKNPTFSNLDLDSKGNVTFTFNSLIDPEFISYEKKIINTTVPIETNPAPTTFQSGTSTPPITSTTTKPTGTTTKPR